MAVTKSAGEGCSVLQAPSSFIGKTVRFSASGHGGDLSDSAVKEFAEQVTLSEEGSMPNVVFMDQGVIVMGSDVATAFSRLCHLERCCEVRAPDHAPNHMPHTRSSPDVEIANAHPMYSCRVCH